MTQGHWYWEKNEWGKAGKSYEEDEYISRNDISILKHPDLQKELLRRHEEENQ